MSSIGEFDIFNDKKLYNDFIYFMEEDEITITLTEEDYWDKYIEYFISNQYWRKLNKYLKKPREKITKTLLNYIQDYQGEGEDEDDYKKIIDQMETEKYNLFITEKIYKTAFSYKLKLLLSKTKWDILNKRECNDS